MASIGHAAVGLLGARLHDRAPPSLRSALLLTALSYLPDADVGMFLWVGYDHPLGHRGAAHSLCFALAAGLVTGLFARGLDHPRSLRLGAFAVLVVASHGLLDTMTAGGGRGVALLWPFDLTRYWSPWRPIPIAPIGLDYLSRRGLEVLVVESLQFLPCFLLAFLPARPRG